MAVLYFTLDADFESCTTTRAIIVKIDAIIAQLLTTALKSVTTGNIAEYRIDTGQTVQSVVYRSAKEVTDTILMYRKIRQAYVNDLLGGEFKTVDGRNLNGRRW